MGASAQRNEEHPTMDTVQSSRALISSNNVEGTNVYSPSGEKIGEIDHLMIEKQSGRVAYAVMSFGGFLGMGHSHYPLPWGALEYDTSLEGYRTNVTEQQLKDSPQYDDDSWNDREWEGEVHRYYKVDPYWR
jgi:hypothetical protein